MLERFFSKRNRVLLKEMVKTDFKLRYQGSVLGMFWSVLKPLMLFAVMYTVFVHFLKFGGDVPYFAVSLLLAITLWNFFGEATMQGMQSIVGRGDLLRKINFPRYLIVISTTVSALINLCINLVVVLILAIISGVDFHWHILFFPLVLLELCTLAIGLAFLFSALYVKFRDIAPIWEVVLQAAFYATPIIYPLSMIVGMAGPTVAKVFLLNPMAQIIQDARYLVVYDGTETVWNFINNTWLALIPLAIVVMICVLAGLYFRKSSKKFTEMI
jgi:ABC-2 type transport system permease protein